MSAVPPLRRVRCSEIDNTKTAIDGKYFFKLIATIDGSLRVNHHQDDQGNEEDNRKDNGDAVEVLLNDVGSLLVVVDIRSNGVGNTGALAGVQKNENDQTNARDNEQCSENDCGDRHFELFLNVSCHTKLVLSSLKARTSSKKLNTV